MDLQPAKVFINIGTNDMIEEPYGDQWFQHLTANIRRIMEQTQAVLPHDKDLPHGFLPSQSSFALADQGFNPVDETADT